MSDEARESDGSDGAVPLDQEGGPEEQSRSGAPSSSSSERGDRGDHEGPILLFDGVCNLCNAAVRWVLERDRREVFAFASLQSRAGQRALAQHGVTRDELPDSMVLIDEDGVQTRSSAALGVTRHLPAPYSWLRFAKVVPSFVRDPVYEWIARNRYRWFGKSDLCRLPSPEERARFLDADEDPTEIAAAEKDRELSPESVPAEPSETSDEGESADGSQTAASSAETRAALSQEVPGTAVLRRFVMLYALVYILPFPLSILGTLFMVPGFSALPVLPSVVGFLVGLHGTLVQPVVLGMGELLFGVTAEVRNTGSGDMTYHYLDWFFDLLLAGALTIAWWAWARRRPISPRVVDAWRVLLRYYLAMTLLSYGWAKAFPVQFPLPGPDRLMQSYGDSSPMGLLWTFMGASPGYQIFGGLMELLGGYLLFFRRTTLLGALVTAGVLTNVVALNVFYDVPVKLYSAHLLLLAVLLALPDVARLAGLFFFNLPVQARDLRRRFASLGVRGRRLVLALKILVIVGLTAINVSGSWGRIHGPGGNLAPHHDLRGLWAVERFEISESGDSALAQNSVRGSDDEQPPLARGDSSTSDSSSSESTLSEEGAALDAVERLGADPERVPIGALLRIADAKRWTRVGLTPPWVGTVHFADGTSLRMRLVVDDEAQTLALFDRGAAGPGDEVFSFAHPEDDRLVLRGPFEGSQLEIHLRRLEQSSLLLTRGFRWVNEYPFNR